MAAYVVFVREKTLNTEEMKLYWSKIAKTFEGHPLTVLAAYGSQEVLEGPDAEGVVIAEFPSMEAARVWYDSKEYKEVAKHRRAGAVYQGYLVLGVDTAGRARCD